MSVIELASGSENYLHWNAVALLYSDEVGDTDEILRDYEHGVSYLRDGYSTPQPCRVFAYDINRRLVLLRWLDKTSTDDFRSALRAFKQIYSRSTVESVLFPYDKYSEFKLSYKDLLSIIDDELGETGLLIGVVKP